MNDSWDLEQGAEIVPGRYAMQLLGGGTNYEAYLAWDDHLFALVVAKVLRPGLVADKGALDGLAREAEILARVNHPVVVRGFGAELEGPRPHVYMEHLEGPHLARLIRKHGPLNLEQLIPLALQLCSAVHYLGVEGIVHLDIKPRNVIMGAPPRLIDLSVARSAADARRLRGHIGTDLYMAPEQCAPGERGEIGTAADVWGLGVTMFAAITGERAWDRPSSFDAADASARFPQLVGPHRPWPKNTPTELADIVDRCLLPDPVDRPSARAVGESLEPLLAALPRRRILGKLRPRLK